MPMRKGQADPEPNPPAEDAAGASDAGDRETLATAGAGAGATPSAARRGVSTDDTTRVTQLTARVRELETEVQRLTPLATFGEAARARLIEDTIREGRRAKGDRFDEARYRRIIEREETIEGIRAFYDEFAHEARKIFRGGRRVRPDGGTPPDSAADVDPRLAARIADALRS